MEALLSYPPSQPRHVIVISSAEITVAGKNHKLSFLKVFYFFEKNKIKKDYEGN